MDSNNDNTTVDNRQSTGKCPVMHGTPRNAVAGTTTNANWWPNQLNLKILHQHSPLSNPMDTEFNYAEEFKDLDLDVVIKDLHTLMTDSKDWWPADYGHYGPFFIRMAWHSAGTYRVGDGRGGGCSGMQRFAPAQQLAGQRQPRQGPPPALAHQAEVSASQLSWADLMILAGHIVALEDPWVFETFGFGGGRADVWEPDEDPYWGPENRVAPGSAIMRLFAVQRELENPLGAVQMGLDLREPRGPQRQSGSAGLGA